LKYDDLQHRFGRDDLLPVWVADMDFRVSPAISEVAERIVKHGIYGYYHRTSEHYEAVKQWLLKYHDVHVTREQILFTPGVVPAISYLIQAFTEEGDGVLIQSPVYYPFYSVIRQNKRKLLINQLVEKDNYYFIDFDDFEKKVSQARLFLLCSPHNPVGRVWRKDELERIAEICLKYKVLIISDEIHSDIVFSGYKHIPMVSVSDEIKKWVITCHSPSKTFNLAGLGLGYVYILNSDLRQRFHEYYSTLYADGLNVFAYETLIAAYHKSHEWYRQMLEYVYNNYLYLQDFISRELPFIQHTPLEATYLVWLDFRALGLSDIELRKVVIERCKLGLNDGPSFGPGGSGFQRINIACPRKTLVEALNRLKLIEKK
jgi:cystathionine beta-lyase